jgi:hypothetical protein
LIPRLDFAFTVSGFCCFCSAVVDSSFQAMVQSISPFSSNASSSHSSCCSSTFSSVQSGFSSLFWHSSSLSFSSSSSESSTTHLSNHFISSSENLLLAQLRYSCQRSLILRYLPTQSPQIVLYK